MEDKGIPEMALLGCTHSFCYTWYDSEMACALSLTLALSRDLSLSR